MSWQTRAYDRLSKFVDVSNYKVLEIGASSSLEAVKPFIASNAAEVYVTGIDHISETNSDIANVHIETLSALELSNRFESNYFDLVFGLSVIEHIPNPRKLVSEVFSVLKPGGYFYIDGSPVWSSDIGHHTWVTKWDDGSSQNYTFDPLKNDESTNPVLPWSHLYMSEDE